MAKIKVDASTFDTDSIIDRTKPENRETPPVIQPPEPVPEPGPEPGPEKSPEPPQGAVMPPAAEPEPVKEKEPSREESKRRRGKAQPEPQDFKDLFLKEAMMKTRSGKVVYICKEHHDRITKILHVIGKNDVSLFSYLFNVLEHHFTTFQEDITELYKENYEGIF